MITALDRESAYPEVSHNAVVQAEWVLGVLAQPSVIIPNFWESHEVAAKVLDNAEDDLIEFQIFH